MTTIIIKTEDEKFYSGPVTMPLYTSIKAIGPDLYLCSQNGIILDGRGRKVM